MFAPQGLEHGTSKGCTEQARSSKRVTGLLKSGLPSSPVKLEMAPSQERQLIESWVLISPRKVQLTQNICQGPLYRALHLQKLKCGCGSNQALWRAPLVTNLCPDAFELLP